MSSELEGKIKVLDQLMWRSKVTTLDIQSWLANFGDTGEQAENERAHALFLLSAFSYFTEPLLRVLLKSLFRDLIHQPLLMEIRRKNSHTRDWNVISPLHEMALKSIRFIGSGNPSESGTHLLYYFRQENELPTSMFISPYELFRGPSDNVRLARGVRRIIFIDDFCGSGTQARRYSGGLLRRIRKIDPEIRFSYFPLFATTWGMHKVRTRTIFDDVQAVCELDESFRALMPDSRYFRDTDAPLDREFARAMCERYGKELEPDTPLGFGDCQLLLGFAHNIPNNTLPIFWAVGNSIREWTPIFPRYGKRAS
jgi:hypothetical protein